MRVWIIGAGGLLGSAITRQATHHFIGRPIPWQDPQQALNTLTADLEHFTAACGADWAIIWAAGAATTASSQHAMDEELSVFRGFMHALSHHLPNGRGAFLLASSAGGIYAGSPHPPFDAQSPAQPTGRYGALKLAQELLASESLSGRLPVVLARIANLYGTGQRLDKTQGLISTLVKAAYTRQPVNIFVQLDTLRDYVFTDDAARLLLHWVRLAAQGEEPGTRVRVIASGDPNSIGSVIATASDVTRIRIPVAFGTHASANAQAPDLRLIPDTDEITRTFPRTSLPDGMKRVALDMMDRIQQGDALAR